MNTIKKINFIILTVIGLLTINSCVKDDDFALPPVVCNDTWESNLTIAELFALVDADPSAILSFDTEQVFEGYVVSSDSTGNFFKTISVQDHPTTPTRALQVEMDRTNLFNNFPLGSKIKVNLKGLNVAYDRGALKVGSTYVDGNGNTRVGRMDEFMIDSHVAKSCEPKAEIKPVVYNSINEAITGAAANGRINTLITINNVQFQETGDTYADAANQTTVNLFLEGSTALTNNQKVILRTSGFADFADQIVPEGSGSITVVLSKYNNDWQLYIRDTNDVKFDQPRYETGDGGGGNNEEATNLLFAGADFENWTTFLGSLNSYGLTEGLAVQGMGTGRDGSNSFYLNGTTGSTNPFVFTVKAEAATVPANPSKITMWVKGSSAKSLSFNLDTATGRVFFNLGELGAENVTLSTQANNQYTGAINTNGEWRLVTLNISGLVLNSPNDLLAMKAGSGTDYDIHIDNIKID